MTGEQGQLMAGCTFNVIWYADVRNYSFNYAFRDEYPRSGVGLLVSIRSVPKETVTFGLSRTEGFSDVSSHHRSVGQPTEEWTNQPARICSPGNRAPGFRLGGGHNGQRRWRPGSFASGNIRGANLDYPR